MDKGRANGVAISDLALGNDALVGTVTNLGLNWAVVTLITDPTFAIDAKVEPSGLSGVLTGDARNPGVLRFQYRGAQRTTSIARGEEVVTNRLLDNSSPSIQSLYPSEIPIGLVSNANQSGPLDQGQVQVSPIAAISLLNVLQILTVHQRAAAHPAAANSRTPQLAKSTTRSRSASRRAGESCSSVPASATLRWISPASCSTRASSSSARRGGSTPSRSSARRSARPRRRASASTWRAIPHTHPSASSQLSPRNVHARACAHERLADEIKRLLRLITPAGEYTGSDFARSRYNPPRASGSRSSDIAFIH